MDIDSLRLEGNSAYKAGNFTAAVQYYTDAITLDSNNYVLFNNRAATYISLKRYDDALKDVNSSLSICRNSKGYTRKGEALHAMGDLNAAVEAYEMSSKLQPENTALKENISKIRQLLAKNVYSKSSHGNFTKSSYNSSKKTKSEYSSRYEKILANSLIFTNLFIILFGLSGFLRRFNALSMFSLSPNLLLLAVGMKSVLTIYNDGDLTAKSWRTQIGRLLSNNATLYAILSFSFFILQISPGLPLTTSLMLNGFVDFLRLENIIAIFFPRIHNMLEIVWQSKTLIMNNLLGLIAHTEALELPFLLLNRQKIKILPIYSFFLIKRHEIDPMTQETFALVRDHLSKLLQHDSLRPIRSIIDKISDKFLTMSTRR